MADEEWRDTKTICIYCGCPLQVRMSDRKQVCPGCGVSGLGDCPEEWMPDPAAVDEPRRAAMALAVAMDASGHTARAHVVRRLLKAHQAAVSDKAEAERQLYLLLHAEECDDSVLDRTLVDMARASDKAREAAERELEIAAANLHALAADKPGLAKIIAANEETARSALDRAAALEARVDELESEKSEVERQAREREAKLAEERDELRTTMKRQRIELREAQQSVAAARPRTLLEVAADMRAQIALARPLVGVDLGTTGSVHTLEEWVEKLERLAEEAQVAEEVILRYAAHGLHLVNLLFARASQTPDQTVLLVSENIQLMPAFAMLPEGDGIRALSGLVIAKIERMLVGFKAAMAEPATDERKD